MRHSAGQDTKTWNEAQRQLKMTCLAACTHHLRPFRACTGLRSQPGAPPSSGSCLHAASADGLRARAPWQGLAAPTERLHTRRLRHTWHARSGTHGRPAPAPAHSLYRALHRPPADFAIAQRAQCIYQPEVKVHVLHTASPHPDGSLLHLCTK